MANFSSLSKADLDAVCAAFGLGALLQVDSIGKGESNSNARLVTERGRCLLRYSLTRDAESLAFEAAVLTLLEQAHFPAAAMRTTLDGKPWVEAAGGKVSLFSWVPGEELARADLRPEHLLELGRLLGRMHQLLSALPIERPNPVGHPTVADWIPSLLADRDPEVTRAAAELQHAFPPPPPGLLPRGVIHGDLLPDNVKWLEGKISGLFDFELTGIDVLALDLAIAINAWCFDQGEYQWALARALIDGYHAERPLLAIELEALLPLLRFGAVRFCASRLRDSHLHKAKSGPALKHDFQSYLLRVRALAGFSAAELTKKLSP